MVIKIIKKLKTKVHSCWQEIFIENKNVEVLAKLYVIEISMHTTVERFEWKSLEQKYQTLLFLNNIKLIFRKILFFFFGHGENINVFIWLKRDGIAQNIILYFYETRGFLLFDVTVFHSDCFSGISCK